MFREKFGEGSYESIILANFEDVDILAGVMDGVNGVVHVVCCAVYHGFWNAID
jgi:hypothetical protein